MKEEEEEDERRRRRRRGRSRRILVEELKMEASGPGFAVELDVFGPDPTVNLDGNVFHHVVELDEDSGLEIAVLVQVWEVGDWEPTVREIIDAGTHVVMIPFVLKSPTSL